MNPPLYIENILKINPSRINIIDVGAWHGDFVGQFKSCVSVPVFSIGVEPNPHLNLSRNYDVFYNCAIDDVEEETINWFDVNTDDSCSSLLRIKSEIITNDQNKNGMWYCPRTIDNIRSRIQVKVLPLSKIVEDTTQISDAPIHFLKIDAQGLDIRVVRSIKHHIHNVMFVQMECVTNKDKEIVLYEGQTTMDDDIKTMNSFGFDVFSIEDYSHTGTPEADVVFINKNF